MAKAKPTKKHAPPKIPDAVAKAPAMRRQKVTARGLPKFSRDMLLAWNPSMLSEYFTQVWMAAKSGDKDALDRIEQLYNLVPSRHQPGPMFNFNLGGQMAVAGGAGQGFDSIVRQLSEGRQPRLLPEAGGG